LFFLSFSLSFFGNLVIPFLFPYLKETL
jgi:hypothetical protein